MIPKAILHEISALATEVNPREVCGFISVKHDSWEIHPVPNAAEDAEREFIMEAQSQIDAMRSVRNSGAKLFGTYHSHPASPPVPSAKDMRLALYPDLVHVIVSLDWEEPEFSLWHISPGLTKRLDDLSDLREEQNIR